MEGSVSGALVPSGTIKEVETWAKFSKFPVEFMTVDAMGMIASSIGCPVQMDEATYAKMEDAKWPLPLRRNKSRRTVVRMLVRVSVTEPLRPSVDVVCPKGRKYTIPIVYDPTPKVCLICFCAGHFDFECCGTKDAAVESMEDDAEAGKDFLGDDLQLAECCDRLSDEVDGEQGAVTTDGEGFLDVNSHLADCIDGLRADINGEQGAVTSDRLDSYEDSAVAEAALKGDSHILPAASCDIGAAAAPEMQPLLPAFVRGVQGTVISEGFDSCEVGELVAVQTIADGFNVTSTVETTAAGLEVAPLLPRCDIGATDPLAMITADPCIGAEQVVGFNGLNELPLFAPVSIFMLHLIMDEIFNEYITVAGKLFGVLLFSLKHSSIEYTSSFEEFSGVNSPKQHHKWREKTDVQGLLEGDSGSGVGFFDFDMQVVDCMSGTRAFSDGVHGAIIIDRAESCEFSPVFETDLEEDFHIIEQVSSLVNSSNKHHEKSDVQGLFCYSYGLVSFGFSEDPPVECKETAAVPPFSDTGVTNSGESAAAILQGMAGHCMIDMQASSGVFRSKKHHIWYEILDEQGVFAFGDLDLLQLLGRLVWILATTNHDQLIFKIQHKWRDKSMD